MISWYRKLTINYSKQADLSVLNQVAKPKTRIITGLNRFQHRVLAWSISLNSLASFNQLWYLETTMMILLLKSSYYFTKQSSVVSKGCRICYRSSRMSISQSSNVVKRDLRLWINGTLKDKRRYKTESRTTKKCKFKTKRSRLKWSSLWILGRESAQTLNLQHRERR